MSRKQICRGLIIVAASLFLSSPVAAQTAKKWDLFLLFGQSNMAGPPAAQDQDKVTNPRIKVLGYSDCSATGRKYNTWSVAKPPLHECFNGVGPADWFSKTLIDTSDKLGLGIDTIGLIPSSFSGAGINMFRKGVTASDRKNFTIPPDNSWANAYPWMVARIKEAQKKGVIRGILFHQGESNPGDPNWPGQVAGIVADLKKDLGLGDIPFLAGELRYDTLTGANNGHNVQVAKLPGLIKNASVVSAKGLKGMPDPWHFNVAAMRTFGHRYCAAIVPYLKTSSIASRKPFHVESPSDFAVYDVRGARVAGFHATDAASMDAAWAGIKKTVPPGIYWMRNGSTGAAEKFVNGR